MNKVTTTIADIAREAGVSKATVSRVINGSAVVKPKTKERVLSVIKKRKYSPSVSAINLSRQTSSTIGVLIPEIDNPFFGEILRGAIDVFDKKDLTIICFNSDNRDRKDYRSLLSLKEHRVKGVLYTPANDYASSNERKKINDLLAQLNGPVVIMDRMLESFSSHDGVFFNDKESIYMFTRKLIAAGHTKIGILNGTMQRAYSHFRQAGYDQAMKEAGLYGTGQYCYSADYTIQAAYEKGCEILGSRDYPTAMIICNNMISLGFLKAMRKYNLKISRDIVCVGLDEIEALDIVIDNFNYIKREGRTMGKAAAELLLHRIEFPDEPVKKEFLTSPLITKKL